jgi:hypothetical protein
LICFLSVKEFLSMLANACSVDKDVLGRDLISGRALLLLWLGAFSYALILALVLQKLVLPMMPSMHAGHGLMRDDAIYFHSVAVEMAERIRMYGWGEWRLIASGSSAGNVGLLAALYALLGNEPAFFLPLTSAFHALGAVLILLIALQLLPAREGLYAGFVAGFLFLAFPSALVWFGQNHKDSFLIAGFLLTLLAFLRCFDCLGGYRFLWGVALFLLGLVLVAIMRPHLVRIYLVAYSCAILCLFFVSVVCRGKAWGLGQGRAAFLICLGFIFMSFLPSSGSLAEQDLRNVEGNFLAGWQWRPSEYLPARLDSLLEKVSAIRVHLINYGISVEAGSIIDADVRPETAAHAIGYFPRALLVGVFAPFPEFWVEKFALPRVIGALEALIFYLFFPGVIFLAFRHMSNKLFVCLVVLGVVLVVNSFVSPNIGSLHRVRYGQWLVVLLIGVCGWAFFIREAVSRLRAVSSSSVVEKVVVNNHASTPDASRAVGAGVLVMMVSLVGFLGLLVRDLLLIDKVGFGSSLDSYYLAIMLPTFFVSLFSVPLGDAFSARVSAIPDRLQVQRMIAGMSTLTLLSFALLAVGMLFFAREILLVFAPGGILI